MITKILKSIEEANRIVIAGHINPDGDCIGAGLALKTMIEQKYPQKEVIFNISDILPNYVEKMGIDYIKKEVKGDIDLLISVDVSNLERVAVTKEMIENAKKTICIDHHISNTHFFDINYVDIVSSASEIIFEFIDKMDVKITKEIAEFIYLGILNDTGCFRHSNVSPRTFEIASELMKAGIDNNKLYQYIFTKTLKKAKIFSNSVINGFFDSNIGLMYYFITKEEIESNSYTRDDMDGTAEYMLTIEGVNVSIFAREEEAGIYKGSFRSKKCDVNQIASKFNGGGHKLAAGFRTNKLEELINYTKEVMLSEKN